ncbi:MAG: chaperonin GroEL, partial [Actinomycetota bacterium]|nr:chaperonin GroEL [Actinomycetota bacterium]
ITLGPRGRHVVIDDRNKYIGPTITNDGVTIARAIELTDPYENLGAQLAKNVATKTNDVAGDGTTTATVLAQAMVEGGLRNVTAGANPTALGRGIGAAAEAVANALAAKATPVTDEQSIAQVATVSSRDPKIGALVGEAMTKVGQDGVITVEESSTMATELEITEGVEFDKGYISPYFVTDAERMETVLTDAYILLHQEKISSIQDLLPLLEVISQAGKPLLVVAEDVEGEALSTLVVNAIRKTLSTVAVKSPFFGDRRKAFMEDLAAITGAKVVDPEVGLKLSEVGLEVLGRARRVVVTRDTTTIVEGGGDQADIDARAAQIRLEIEESDSDWEREKFQERLAKLIGGVAVVKVGAATETELKERKGRIEDAVAAARAAAEEGIIPGGGAALVQVADSIGDLGLTGDEATGVAIVRKACAAPLYWIAANAGFEGSVVVAKVREAQWGHGFDAETQTYGDLVAAGIIDPVKVTRSAVVNAASIARMVITTESAVVDKPEKTPPAGQGHGHGHGHGH